MKICIKIFIMVLIIPSCKKSVYIAPQLPDTVSFRKHVVPVFTANCTSSPCHGGAFPQGSLNLEAEKAYAQLWAKDMIDTVRADHSLLYSSMISVDKPMPPSGRLDTFYIKTVLRWIRQGARNN